MSNRGTAVLPLFLFVLYALPNVAYAQPEKWVVDTLKLPSVAVRLFMSGSGSSFGRIRIKTRNKGWFTLSVCGGKPCAKALRADYERAAPPPNALPDAEVARGTRNIRAVWLAGPTRRYAHGVLGDAIEAGSVVVEDRQGRRHTLSLPQNAVFEDRFARLADLDDDGSDEIILVKSYLNQGAALAVLNLTPKGLEIIAETPPIGRANRWLNPAGIADYDGDQRDEIAIVVTPHIGGRLEFWNYRDRKLYRKMQWDGFSNHVIGSRAQRMSASADFDGDGVTDLALPSSDRQAIRIISLKGGSVAQIARITLPGRVVSEILAIRSRDAKRPVLVMGLDTDQLAIVR